jgi:hypothetical protein
MPAAGVAIGFDVPAELHIESKVRPRDLPWISETQPWIGDFALPSIANFLIEDAELVSDAITDCGHLKRGHGFHEARGETSEAAGAQPGFFFMLDQFVEIDAEFFSRPAE